MRQRQFNGLHSLKQKKKKKSAFVINYIESC